MTTDRKKPEITTAIILETRIKDKDEKHPVKLRVYDQIKRKYYTIKNERYTSTEFNKIMNPDSRGNNKTKRKKFEAIENRAIHIIDNVLANFTFDAFEEEFKNTRKKDTSIQGYFEAKAYELEKAEKIQTANLYRATLKSLLYFDNKVSFDKITPAYLKKYENHMIEHDHAYTTIGIYMRHFKHIINLAIQDKVPIEYPFGTAKGKYQIPVAKNIKKALTLSEIEKLFHFKPESRNEKLAQQYFLFSYLCNGMNFVDIANLKYKNIKENNIQFIRQKTKDTTKEKTFINVTLMPQIKEIIENIGNRDKDPENYLFPIFKAEFTEMEKHNRIKQFIKNTNKYLRQIAGKIGISDNITTYWARHTYSTIQKRSGTPIEFIAEQLGHKSTRVTTNYLDSFEDEQREKYAQNTLPESMRRRNN